MISIWLVERSSLRGVEQGRKRHQFAAFKKYPAVNCPDQNSGIPVTYNGASDRGDDPYQPATGDTDTFESDGL